MNPQIQKQNYSPNVEFINGLSCGVCLSTGIAGLYDFMSDETIDNPLLIGIPLIASIATGIYIKVKYGLYPQGSDLER